MLAQTGVDVAVGGLLAPFLLLWLVAAGYLLLLIVLGFGLALIRAWNARQDRSERERWPRGESNSQAREGTAF